MAPQTPESETQTSSPEPFLKTSSDRKEIYYDGYFYDVTEWIPKHPGGSLIKFYTQPGEDATIPIQQFHKRSWKRMFGVLKSLKKRRAEPGELGLDPETAKRHETLTRDFQAFEKELEAEGYFEPSIPHLIGRFVELGLFVLATAFFFQFQSNWICRALSIISLGIFMGRVGWFQHEAGHHSLTGNSKIDRLIQAVVFGLGIALSSSWWSSQHYRHHAMPQRLKHDVDLDTLPLIAFDAKVVKNPKKQNNWFIRYQALLFLFIDTGLVATFWKLYLHPRSALKRRDFYQIIPMIGHYYFAYNFGLFNYLFSCWLASMYMFSCFALSHTHLPVNTGKLHWVEYAFLHTTDISPEPWCDWWMGYLNYQIEHHLFPTMPEFRQPQIQKRVKEFAEKHGIPFYLSSYWSAMKTTLKNLDEVAKELREAEEKLD